MSKSKRVALTKYQWIHQRHTNSAIVAVNYDYPNCAICRKKLNDFCVDCQISDFTSQGQQQRLLTLLMMWKRRGTLFFNLDRHIISKIYKFSLVPIDSKVHCRVVSLECQHSYHRHCFQKWETRYHKCPLDNLADVIPIKVDDIKRCYFWVDLVKIAEVPRDRKYISENTMTQRILAFIVRKLKHHPPGYEFEKLNRMCDVSYDTFLEYINMLIAKEFIARRENLLVYVP